jgi:hypothetical protein
MSFRSGNLAGRFKEIAVAKEVIGLLGVVLAQAACGLENLHRLRAIVAIVEPGNAAALRPQDLFQRALVIVRPGDIHCHAGERQVLHVIDGKAQAVKAPFDGLEVERREQNGGIDRARHQRRGPRRRCAGKHHVKLAGLDAVRLQHAFDVDAGNVFGAAKRDQLALQIGEALDARLGDEIVGRCLHFQAQDGDWCAHADRAQGIDQPGRNADVERTGRDLLHQRRARLHIEDVRLDPFSGIKALFDADQGRPHIGRGLPDRAEDKRLLLGMRGNRREGE